MGLSGMHLSDLLYLVLFVGVSAAVLYALKRLQHTRLPGLPQRRIRILDAISVGPRQRVVLLRVKDRELLVGVTAQQITLLAEFPLSDEEHAGESIATASTAADTLHRT